MNRCHDVLSDVEFGHLFVDNPGEDFTEVWVQVRGKEAARVLVSQTLEDERAKKASKDAEEQQAKKKAQEERDGMLFVACIHV